MSNSQSPRHYSTLGLALHWGMAALMLAAFLFGQYLEDLPRGPEKLDAIGWHLLLGASVLLLIVPRLLWRFSSSPLAEEPNETQWQKRVAKAGHGLLYFLMIALPVSGLLIVTSISGPLPVLGLFELPNLFASKGLHDAMEGVHGILSKALVFTVIAHLLATGWHYFIRRDGIAQRMIPHLKVRGETAIDGQNMAGNV